MATSNNNFLIGSMIDLLDRLIDHQSKNTVLLSELKSSLIEIRSESAEILLQLREKLPENLSREQEENYRKLAIVTAKAEDNNIRISDNIKIIEKEHQELKHLIDRNTQVLNENTLILDKDNFILNRIDDLFNKDKNNQEEDKKRNEEISIALKQFNNFFKTLKSKKAWVALLLAIITALSTMISSVVRGIESIKNISSTQSSHQEPIKPVNKP